MNHKTKDILDRIEDSSPNESSHELFCRLRDCAREIETLRAALASRPDAQAESVASQDESDLCERIIHAVEGECDGLAITEEQASDILAYLQYGAPMNDVRRDAERYRKLRAADINAIHEGGIFVGLTPNNVVINGDDLDIAVDLLIDDAAAPSPDREQVGESAEAARIVKMWYDGHTQLAGKRAVEMLRNASPSSECGERQECPHGVDDGACKQCYGEAVRGAKGYSKEWCMRMAALEPADGIPPAGIAASAPTLGEAKPVAWTSLERLDKIAKKPDHVDTMWGNGRIDQGDVPLYRAAPAVAQPLTDAERNAIRSASLNSDMTIEQRDCLRALLSKGA